MQNYSLIPNLSLFLRLVLISGPKGRLKFEAVFTILVQAVDNYSQFFSLGQTDEQETKLVVLFKGFLKGDFSKVPWIFTAKL